MSIPSLPTSVEKALGREASRDLEFWLKKVISEAIIGQQLPISAFAARQKVNAFVLDRISNLLLAGNPELISRPDRRWIWSVPVDLTATSRGRIGRVGTLEIDAQSGEILFSDSQLSDIEAEAERLTKSLSR